MFALLANSWAANSPDDLDNVLTTLEGIHYQCQSVKQVSLADLIVLGGAAAIEQAAERAGVDVEAPFIPGQRMHRRSRLM